MKTKLVLTLSLITLAYMTAPSFAADIYKAKLNGLPVSAKMTVTSNKVSFQMRGRTNSFTKLSSQIEGCSFSAKTNRGI